MIQRDCRRVGGSGRRLKVLEQASINARPAQSSQYVCPSTIPSSTGGFLSVGAQGQGRVMSLLTYLCDGFMRNVLIKELLQLRLQTAELQSLRPKSDAGINISRVWICSQNTRGSGVSSNYPTSIHSRESAASDACRPAV